MKYFFYLLTYTLLFSIHTYASTASSAVAQAAKIDNQNANQKANPPVSLKKRSSLSEALSQKVRPVTQVLKERKDKKESAQRATLKKYQAKLLAVDALEKISLILNKTLAKNVGCSGKEDAESYIVSLAKIIGKKAVSALPATAGKPEINRKQAINEGFEFLYNITLAPNTPVIALDNDDKSFYFGVVVGDSENGKCYLVQTAQDVIKEVMPVHVGYIPRS